MSEAKKIAVLGLGAIGSRVLEKLRDEIAPKTQFATFGRAAPSPEGRTGLAVAHFTKVEDLAAWGPDLTVECAGHGAVANEVPRLLNAGSDVMIVSIGALADVQVRECVYAAAARAGSRLITVSGAMGGLDALKAARGAELSEVTYVGRKPPLAWKDTPAEAVIGLDGLEEPRTFFVGNAAEAAVLFPKNANVTAAVALAGLGFERTVVKLIADPMSLGNTHELEAIGAFGRLHVRLENTPLPDNPKTSWLAALSIEAALRSYLNQNSSTP